MKTSTFHAGEPRETVRSRHGREQQPRGRVSRSELFSLTIITRSVADIERDPSIGLAFQGKAGLMGLVGAPGLFIHVEGGKPRPRQGTICEHWQRARPLVAQGIELPDDPDRAKAKRIHYWDGMEEAK